VIVANGPSLPFFWLKPTVIGPIGSDIRVITPSFSHELVVILGHHCWFLAKNSSDAIIAGSWLEWLYDQLHNFLI
jgi:hypothetical protein